MLRASFNTLKIAGCIQCENDNLLQMFRRLMFATEGDPCTTGCPAFHDGKCKVFQQYHSVPKDQRLEKTKQLEKATTPNNGTGKWAGMTMKQIARTERISLNEARRRKATGRYNNVSTL